MILKAFAKLNWTLDITGVRPDGYHLMDMLMQPISLADEITLTLSDHLSIATGGYPPSRADESNLAMRAARLLQDQSGTKLGAAIYLHKQIPIGAGLGGGSADAAAVLFGLNRLWNTGFSLSELEKFGLSLGADVPFCLRGGLCRTRGIGEDLENHFCKSNFWLLVFQPGRSLSTGEIFTAYHASPAQIHPDTESALQALEQGCFDRLCASISNVLESVSSLSCPDIPEAIHSLKKHGASAAIMTGSGSAVFGVFKSRPQAEKARSALSARWPRIHLCHTQSDSIRIMEES